MNGESIIEFDWQEKAEEMKERLEDFASAQEKRAYIQGYADCVQALYHMGLLKENEGLQCCLLYTSDAADD